MNSLSVAEARLLVGRQVGRQPSISFSVAGSCRYGWPAVIRNAPFDETGSPNPNLFYLCCPFLRKQLAQLEGAGVTGKLQELIAKDPGLAAALKLAQADHARQWEEAAGGPVKTAPPGPRIAAAGEDLLLKCLHAHCAYGLVHGGYQIGPLIIECLDQLWCDDERCRTWLDEIKLGSQGEER